MFHFHLTLFNDMKKIIITIFAFCYSVSSFCQAWAMDEAADDARESEPLSSGAIFLLMIIAAIIYAIIKFRDSVEEHNENAKKIAAKKEQEHIQQKLAVALKRIADEDGVDLGLSVKWAKYNLGATSDSDFGYLLRWGLNEKGKAGNHIPDEDVVNISGNYDYDALHTFKNRYIDIDTDNCTGQIVQFIEEITAR